jgi:hypothetical protein
MAGWIYSLSILFIFQSFEVKAYTPSLVGLMAEVNDLTSVYNNPGALGFLSVDKKFQINLLIDVKGSIKKTEYYSHGEVTSSFPQIILENDAFISLYSFGFYFAMKSYQDTWFPVVARRFGNFAAGFQLKDNSLNLGTLFMVNDKIRVAFAGNIIYDPLQLHGRGGLIYQPLDWYYFGIDVFPHSRKFKIVNSFLYQRFGFDNISMGVEMNNGSRNPEWKTFIQGIFSLKYLQLAVGWNSGLSYSTDVIDELSDSYGFNILLSLNFGL